MDRMFVRRKKALRSDRAVLCCLRIGVGAIVSFIAAADNAGAIITGGAALMAVLAAVIGWRFWTDPSADRPSLRGSAPRHHPAQRIRPAVVWLVRRGNDEPAPRAQDVGALVKRPVASEPFGGSISIG